MLVPQRVERFWTSVPRPFMERILRSLFDNYILADKKCRDFEKEEKANVLPFYRRGLIEQSIRAVAVQFPKQVVAKAVKYEGYWYHSLVICNDDVALTENALPNPDAVVRNSCFRYDYAKRDNQLYLFSDMAPEQPPSDSLLYGIIVHGRSRENPLLPGFAQVRFPKPKLDGYYRERVDLFAEFPEVVKEMTKAAMGLPAPLSEEVQLEPELLAPADLPDGIVFDTKQFGA